MSNKVNSFQERFKGKIENMGKDGVIGLVKTTHNTSPIIPKPIVQITKQQPQTNDPFASWKNTYNNAQKGTKKGNIASSGAMIANQQQHPPIPQSQPLYHHLQQYTNNYPMMMQQQQPTYFPIPIGYQQPIAPYNSSPYPPVLNYPPSHQINYLPPYIHPIQHQQEPLYPSNQNNPININITNTVQQPSNNENKQENIIQNDYKPYTLEEYKELNRVAVVMGNLGPNIGTKEWEEKKKKMKRITDYANRLNKEHKGITRIKTYTPADEKAKERQSKIENSHRFKSYEYSKLVRPKGETSDQFYYKDIGNVQTKNEKSDQILNELNNNNERNTNEFTINKQLSQKEKNNLNGNQQQSQNQTIDNNNNSQLEYLLKQKETYKNKIDAIKESLL